MQHEVMQPTGFFSLNSQKNNFPSLSSTIKNSQNSGSSASINPRNSSSGDMEEEEELQIQPNQSLESIILKVPKKYKAIARQLLIIRQSDHGPVVTIDVDKCNLWSYLASKATVIKTLHSLIRPLNPKLQMNK